MNSHLQMNCCNTSRHASGRAASALVLASALLLSGCGSKGASFSLLQASANFSQSASTVNDKIDVLWVVDNSGSMDPLQKNLTTNFSSFMSTFVSKGFDYRLAVTTTDSYLATPSYDNVPAMAKYRDGLDPNHSGFPIITPATPNVLQAFITNSTQGSGGSGDERAFQSMAAALASPLNAGFPRPGAFLAVIILSDEDDFTDYTRSEGSWLNGGVADHSYTNPNLVTVDSVVSSLDQITGSAPDARHYNVSAITALDQACVTQQHNNGSRTSIIGARYVELANKTGGVTGSVCDTSFSTSLNLIQQRIVELGTAFKLDRLPVVASIQVLVNNGAVTQSTANGWSYDAIANAVVFHGAAVPPAGSSISVTFDPQTIQ